MPLSALATMIADDVIVALQAFPVGFGGGAMIQVALEHASKQLPTTGVEELLDFAMVKVLGRGVVQGRHHVGECFEGTGKLFPFVDGGVCLGHEDVSFEYVDVGFSDTYYGDVSLAIPNLYNSLKSINFHIVLKEPHPLVQGYFLYQALGERSFKGIRDPLQIYRILDEGRIPAIPAHDL